MTVLEDTIQKIEDWKRRRYTGLYNHELRGVVDDALAILKEYRENYAKIPRWIPVTERLPETNEKVLVYVFDPDFCGPYIEFSHWLNWLKRWGEFDDEVGDFGDYTIIAWMPLPEPPKEEDNANGH